MVSRKPIVQGLSPDVSPEAQKVIEAVESSPEDCVDIPSEYHGNEDSPNVGIGEESKPNHFNNFHVYEKRSDNISDDLACEDNALDEMDLIGDGFFENLTIAADPEPAITSVEKRDTRQSPCMVQMTFQSMLKREEASHRVRNAMIETHLDG